MPITKNSKKSTRTRRPTSQLTSAKLTRVNARLDLDTAQKLQYLVKVTERTLSDVIKYALNLYYHESQNCKGNALKNFSRAGFLGCIDAEPNYSEVYRTEVEKMIAGKYRSEESSE